MLIPSLAIGLLYAAYRCNPLPRKTAFYAHPRPHIGRTCVLLVLPVGNLSLKPISAGFAGIASTTSLFSDFSNKWHIAMVMWLLLPVCYVIACVLGVTFRNRWRKVLAFIVVWSGCVWITFASGSAQWQLL